MIRNCFITTLLLTFFVLSYAQDDSQNVENLGQLDYDANLSDIWGYATETNEYALVGLFNAFSIVDVTNPARPMELHRVPGAASTWRDIKTWNSFAYVVNETGGGCLIVDMSELPDKIETFEFTGDDGRNFQSAHNVYIDNNGYLYIIGSNYRNGGCLIYDLNENPTEPRFVGLYDAAYVHDAYARDNLLYTFEGGDLVIVDITDIANPTILGNATSFGYTHNGWLSDDGKTLYTTDETLGAWVVSWDVSDPTDITLLDRWQSNPGSGSAPHNAFVLGDFVITAYYTDGVTITNVSDPSNMIQVGNYDTSTASGGFNGAWGVYPYLPSGNLLVTDVDNGLFVLEPDYVQPGFLHGKVIDAKTELPIFNAKVLVDGETILTDENGVFKLGNVDSIQYEITTSKLGYDVNTVTEVQLVPGETTTIEIALNQQPRVYNVNGNILNINSNEIIENGTVNFILTGEDIAIETIDGKFSIDSLYVGEYSLIAGAWGYYPVQLKLNVQQSNQNIDIFLNEGIYDDFVLDYGWTSENLSDVGGAWEIVDPQGHNLFGFATLPSVDVSNDFGNTCFVTGDSESFDFVGGGNNTLISPLFDCTTMEKPHISFYSYFTNFGYFGPGNETVDFMLTNGNDTTLLDFDDSDNADLEWKFHNVAIPPNFELTESMQFFVVANGPDGQELLESGLDVFQVVDSATVATDGSTISLVDDVMPNVLLNTQNNSYDVRLNDEVTCENASYYVLSYDRQYFSNIAIDENGVLSFDVNNFAALGEYEITYGATCGGLDQETASVKVTIDDEVGIFNANSNIIIFGIVPNPATNRIEISGLQTYNLSNLQVKVYNATGQQVLNNALQPDYSMAIDDLSNGLYMLSVIDNDIIIGNAKFIVE